MSRPPSHRDPREESHYMAGQDALNRWNEFGLAEIECTDVPPKQMVRSFCITNKQLILSTNDDVTYAFQFTPEKSFYSDSRTELTPLKNIRLLDVRYGLEHQAFLTLDGSLYLLGSLAFLGPFDESVAGNEDEDTIFKYYYVSNEAKLPQLAWRKTMGVIKAIRCGDYFTAFMAEINHNQHRVIVFGKNPYFQFHTNHKKVMWYVTEELDVNDPVAIEAGKFCGFLCLRLKILQFNLFSNIRQLLFSNTKRQRANCYLVWQQPHKFERLPTNRTSSRW